MTLCPSYAAHNHLEWERNFVFLTSNHTLLISFLLFDYG